jgi:hypothetical protein
MTSIYGERTGGKNTVNPGFEKEITALVIDPYNGFISAGGKV